MNIEHRRTRKHCKRAGKPGRGKSGRCCFGKVKRGRRKGSCRKSKA